jgi:DNA sulfur modification protein DndD
MFIDSILLYNFRAYKGENRTIFNKNGKNVFVIAGNNGFGKTTYLTALVWCLYGKMMVDVDDKFRRDINDAQGYKGFAKAGLNNLCINAIERLSLHAEDKRTIVRKGYIDKYSKLSELTKYYVEIHIVDVFIPSIPCSEVTIRRTYDFLLDSESIEVLIDGQVNELAREVGYDIFINDFILSKDIAKFFLFDAEKIVNLAEVKSIEEKRKLSTAYSEVLGIKKYEDIKKNLENLRLKFRKKAGTSVSQTKLIKLASEVENMELSMTEKESSRTDLTTRIDGLRSEKDALQEKLIREGNAISVEELNRLKAGLTAIKEKDSQLKAKLRDMMDIAPFAIAGNLFSRAMDQSVKELKTRAKTANAETLLSALTTAKQAIISGYQEIELTERQKGLLGIIINDSFSKTVTQYSPEPESIGIKTLFDFTLEEHNAFKSLYDNIKLSFSLSFKQLVKDLKNNSIFMQKTQRKIAAAEQDDGEGEVREIRARKAVVESQLKQYEEDSRILSEQIGLLNRDLGVKKKQLSECMKLVKVDELDKDKDAIAERLIWELNEFLCQLKEKRKASLEGKIKREIDILMHKTHFIEGVSMDIRDSIIDINLLDKDGQMINKEKLSKGEQQLYATAILKALVDESGISFPVFIDSPLQKFDSIHSKNIISKFYPAVSKQVVIFPLLGKELSESEYDSLLPNVNTAYVIQNNNGVSSFLEVNPAGIFNYID